MKGKIYKIINLLNEKIYVGLYTKDDFENYWGSGLLIKRAIEKYGVKNFRKEIIEDNIEDLDLLRSKEIYYITFFNSIQPNGYNICQGGTGGDIYTNNPDLELIKEKISLRVKGKQKGIPKSEEHRRKNSEVHKGQICSEEKRKYQSEVMKGRKQSEETIKKRVETRKRNGNTACKEEIKIKISISNLGKINKNKGLSYEEIYGLEKAKEIKRKMSLGIKKSRGTNE